MNIAPGIDIPDELIELRAVRAAGPGGQNVNKVSSAVQLRLDVRACSTLPEQARERILALRDQRVTSDGCIVIKARNSRSQLRNREEALERLRELILEALEEPVARKRTRPPRSADRRRLEEKSRRANIKKSRARPEE